MLRAQRLNQPIGQGDIGTFLPSTFLTDQVKMRLRVHGVIDGWAVADVGVGDQPDVDENLQGPVDRRGIDIGQRLGDLFRSGVPQTFDRFPHLLALRGAAVAGLPQHGLEVSRHG